MLVGGAHLSESAKLGGAAKRDDGRYVIAAVDKSIAGPFVAICCGIMFTTRVHQGLAAAHAEFETLFGAFPVSAVIGQVTLHDRANNQQPFALFQLLTKCKQIWIRRHKVSRAIRKMRKKQHLRILVASVLFAATKSDKNCWQKANGRNTFREEQSSAPGVDVVHKF